MRPILTPQESAELDRRSAERGIAVGTLMENAGAAVARAAIGLAGGSYGKRAVVVRRPAPLPAADARRAGPA